MKKRLFGLLLALSLLVGLIPGTNAAAVPEAPDRELFHPTELDLEAVLAQLPKEQKLQASPASREVPVRSAYDEFEIIPYINYVGQYRVVGQPMNLNFLCYTPGKLNLDWYQAIYQGEPDNGTLISVAYGEVSSTAGYDVVPSAWSTDGCAAGTYSVVLFAATRGSDPQILENSAIAYHVYLTKTAVPMTGVRLVDLQTGKEVTNLNIRKGTEDIYPITLEFLPANTTDSRWLDYFCIWDEYVTVDDFAGYLYVNATAYCTVSALAYSIRPEANFTIQVCTDAKGHNCKDPEAYPNSMPTCTEEGFGRGTCTKCSKTVDTVIPALGHDWVPGEILVPEEGDEWGTRAETCSRCGESRETSFHTCPADVFTDRVPDTHWAHKAIDYVLNHGLMNGMSATKFEPNGTLTRAQLVTILYRLSGAEAGETEVPFTDLTQAWYKDAVAWAFENGIVNGMTDTTFAPNVKVNRAMFATIMFRYYSQYLGLEAEERADLSAFPDAGKVSSWAKEPIAWANAKGLINGVSRGGKIYLDPAASATRAQAATILMRFCEMIG